VNILPKDVTHQPVHAPRFEPGSPGSESSTLTTRPTRYYNSQSIESKINMVQLITHVSRCLFSQRLEEREREEKRRRNRFQGKGSHRSVAAVLPSASPRLRIHSRRQSGNSLRRRSMADGSMLRQPNPSSLQATVQMTSLTECDDDAPSRQRRRRSPSAVRSTAPTSWTSGGT
jgi:hypothetical protein